MRFFHGIITFTLLASGVTGDGTSNDPAQLEEQPHQRMTFHNWDYKDLGTSAFEDLPPLPIQPAPLPINQTNQCPDGWMRYSDSCYFFEKESLGFAKAERKCQEKQATLFVANSLDEWNSVRSHSEKIHFSWVGLVRFTQYERLERLPRWQTTGSINPLKINWLIKPYSPLSNGWSSFANCAALFQSTHEIASYAYFYPCTLPLNSICERNSTIVNARN